MSASDLGWQGWIVVATIIIALIVMAGDWVGPDLTFTLLVSFYMAARIITVDVASANYGNSGLLTVIFLYPVAEGIYQTGGMEWLMTKVLGRSRSTFWAIVRMGIPTMVLSAFLNNTPVVALLTPILLSWSKRSGIPAKKLLIPLSYAAVLGGTCTLIGTSTNLVISGAQQQRYAKTGQATEVNFGIFDIAPVGVPYAIWGFLFVLATQKFLLPGNSSKYSRNVLVALRVLPSSLAAGKTLLDAGLYKAHGSTLVALGRGKEFERLPVPRQTVQAGDVLYYGGELENLIATAEEQGLLLVTNEDELSASWQDINGPGIDTKKIIQVTVKPDSSLIGVKVSAAGFRSTYDLALLGLERGHGRFESRFNDVTLVEGDVLLFEQGISTDIHSDNFKAAFHKYYVVRDSQVSLFVGSYVVSTNDIAGKTITEAGLRGMPGIHVIALDPQADISKRSQPIDLHHVLEKGDLLWVAADVAGITFLSKYPGLEQSQQGQINRHGVHVLDQGLTQAVVSPRSGLIGLSARDVRFRTKYKAALIAVQREGANNLVDVSSLTIQPGDVLLLNGATDWARTYKNDRNFVLLSSVSNSSPPKRNRALIAMFLGVAMVATQIIPSLNNNSTWINLFPGAVLTFIAMLATGCLSADQARQSILWDVYITIAAAFGVSSAMQQTGVAKEFAQVFISIANRVGTQGAGLTAVYVATALLSELLTNNAAGAIMYPIAAIAGDALGVTPRKMSIAVMLGASAGFINPYSYQCNLMVFSAGNYRTLEFAKIGAPFQAYLLVVAGFILHLIDHWHQVWIVSWVLLGAVIAFPAGWAALPVTFTTKVETAVGKFFSSLAFWKKNKNLDRNESGYGGALPLSSSSSFSDSGKK